MGIFEEPKPRINYRTFIVEMLVSFSKCSTYVGVFNSKEFYGYAPGEMFSVGNNFYTNGDTFITVITGFGLPKEYIRWYDLNKLEDGIQATKIYKRIDFNNFCTIIEEVFSD